MRAFVTGATGFLGHRVVARLLSAGDTVTALVRPTSDRSRLADLDVRIEVGDLTDPGCGEEAVAAADVVYHLGGRVVAHGSREEFDAVNVEATARLREAAGRVGARFVHMSSLGLFDIPQEGMTLTEDASYDPNPELRGHYTRSKLEADRACCDAARDGADVIVVRAARTYGPDHPVQTVFLGRVKRFLAPDRLLVVSSGSYLIPLCYAENVADAVVLAGRHSRHTGPVHILDDPTLDQRRYFATLSKVRNTPLKVHFLPVGLIAPAVLAVDGLHRLARRRPWSVAHQLLRSGRSAHYPTDVAQEALGWRPQVDLETALSESLAPSGREVFRSGTP